MSGNIILLMTDGEIPSAARVEEVVRAMYLQQGNQQGLIEQYQSWLQSFQSLTASWDIGRQLLSSEYPEVRFFGALTLQIKISRDWPTLPYESINILRTELINQLIQSARGPAYITTKLSSAAMRQHMSETNDIVERISIEIAMLDFLTVLPQEIIKAVFPSESQRARYIGEIQTEINVALETAMTVLEMQLSQDPELAEVVSNLKKKALLCVHAWTQVQMGPTIDRISIMGSILNLVIAHIPLEATFETACQVMVEMLALPELSKYEQSVCDGLIPVLSSGWVCSQAIRSIEEEDTHVAQQICALISQFAESFPKYFVKNITRPDVQTIIDLLLRFSAFPGYFGIDEEISIIAHKFWYELDETLCTTPTIPKPSYIPKYHITTDPVTHQPILHKPGHVDARRIMLKKDNSDLGSSGSLTGNVTGDVVPGVASSSGVDPILPDEDPVAVAIWTTARQVFRKLVVIVRGKVERPSEPQWNLVKTETKQMFKGYRIDMEETLEACHNVLGDEIFEILVSEALTEAADLLENRSMKPEKLEATLYCIRCLAGQTNVSNAKYLSVLFGDAFLGRFASSSDSYWTVRVTLCLIIGEEKNPQWLSRNPSFILPVVSFLVNSIQAPRVVKAALSGLENVCAACRDGLSNAADEMVGAWERFSGSLSIEDRTRLIRSVSRVLNPLPPRRQTPLVMRLISSMIAETRAALTALAASSLLSQPPGAEIVERGAVLDFLRLIKGVCDGIQGSDDAASGAIEEYDGGPPAGDEVMARMGLGFGFGFGGDDKRMSDREKWVMDEEVRAVVLGVSGTLWETVQAVLKLFWGDQEIVESTFTFINSTLCGVTPPIFSAPETRIGSLILDSYTQLPFSCQLRTLTIFLQGLKDTSGNDLELRRWVTELLSGILSVSFRVLGSAPSLSDRSEIVEPFFKMLAKALYRHPRPLLDLPLEQQTTLYLQLIPKALSMPERPAVQATMDFVRNLVSYDPTTEVLIIGGVEFEKTGGDESSGGVGVTEKDVEKQRCREAYQTLVRGFGEGVVGVILAGIGGAQPSSMLPMLADLFHRFVHYYPLETKEWVIKALQTEGFPSRHCTAQHKEEFVKGMMAAPKPREFKEAIKTFSQQCRNLQGSSYGASLRV
ncbi:Importin-13 [Blyttiomyces sp. JEL0837]|nr:Importin-13 [Blyttiomyces sp. JEL0837]